jgi:hypothetical protein
MTEPKIRLPVRYVPTNLSKKDKRQQLNMLLKSRRLYKKNKYYTRKRLPSYKNKPSKHIANAQKIYAIDNIRPSKELALKTGCSLSALNQIVKKGEGAYYSSGSRPNQTAHSWGYARLASALTAGKASAIDYTILQKGCNPNKKAFKLATQARRKYGTGHSHTKRTRINLP